MTQRNQSDSDPDFDLLETEEMGQGGRARRAPDRAPAFLRFSHLTNFAVDGREDAQAAMRFIVTTNFSEDQELQRRAIRGATDLRGVFYRETRNKSQGILRRDTIEVRAESGAAASNTTGNTTANTTTTVPVEQSSAQAINGTTETIRATKELIKEFAPAPTKPEGVTREDVQSIVRETVRDSLAEVLQTLKPATAPVAPVDPFSMVERVVELQRKLTPPAPPQSTQPAQQGDEFDRVLSLIDRIDSLRERVGYGGGGEESGGAVDKVIRFAERHIDTVAPLAQAFIARQPGRVQELVAGAEAVPLADAAPLHPQGAQGQAPQPAPPRPAQPQNTQEASGLIFNVAASDSCRGKRPGRCADLIEELCVRFPELNGFVDQFIAMPPETALAMLEQATGRNDLASFSGALSYIEGLQDELRGEGEDDPGDAEAQGDGANIVEMASAQAS